MEAARAAPSDNAAAPGGGMERSRRDRCPIPMPSRPWRSGSPGFSRGGRWSRCGCWNTRRSTPPARARKPMICSIRKISQSSRRAVAGSTPITGRVSAWPTSCLDLAAARRRMDLRCFVRDLERWLIGTLAEFGVAGVCRSGRVGIWVETDGGRSQDCSHRGARAPLGHVPRRLAERRPRSRSLPGHRRLRHSRARRHLARSSRDRGHNGRRGPGAAAQFRHRVRLVGAARQIEPDTRR